jgi:aryl-alcohol dehydrogenase-like predicted oxidoreductase
LNVSLFALGSWRTFERIPREQGLAVMQAARESGIAFLDDARYNDETGEAPIPTGYSEVVFGELFRAAGWVRDDVVVANKLWWEFWPQQDAAAELDSSLGRMGLDHIDLIYITLPMARQLGNDADQWAALLGHEAGHLAKEHQKANASRQATLQGTATALGFIPLPLIGAVARAIAVPIAATAINAHYSRDQEREADALSVQYMVAAGYDPQGAIHLQETLLAMGGGKGGAFFSSHPGGQERIKNIQAAIEQQSPRTYETTNRPTAPAREYQLR